jgi:hypothetical protein
MFQKPPPANQRNPISQSLAGLDRKMKADPNIKKASRCSIPRSPTKLTARLAKIQEI